MKKKGSNLPRLSFYRLVLGILPTQASKNIGTRFEERVIQVIQFNNTLRKRHLLDMQIAQLALDGRKKFGAAQPGTPYLRRQKYAAPAHVSTNPSASTPRLRYCLPIPRLPLSPTPPCHTPFKIPITPLTYSQEQSSSVRYHIEQSITHLPQQLGVLFLCVQ